MAHPRILCNCSITHIPEAKQNLESVGKLTYAEHKYPRLLEVIGEYDVEQAHTKQVDKIKLQFHRKAAKDAKPPPKNKGLKCFGSFRVFRVFRGKRLYF